MVAYLDGRVAGLAVWGYGIKPRHTARHLFGPASSINDYLELCRFFVHDWTPRFTASRFLALTHRILHRHLPHVKYLYTYAAGFQGLVGTIYQASNYWYIGRTPATSFIWFPGHGLVHAISLWHRYGGAIGGSNNKALREVQKFAPNARRWCGYNFRYIYFLCSDAERDRLMKTASFERQPNPTKADLAIWTENVDGEKVTVTPEAATSVPVISLRTMRGRSADSGTPASSRRGRRTSDPSAP